MDLEGFEPLTSRMRTERSPDVYKRQEQLEALHIPAAQDVTLENLSFAYGEGPIFR